MYLTPYQYASNTPIWAIDIDGLEAGHSTGETAVKEETARDPKSDTNDQNKSGSLWCKAARKLGGFIGLMLSPLECCKGQNSVDLGDIGLPDLDESEDPDSNPFPNPGDKDTDEDDDIHRIGGSSIDNLRIKPKEEKLVPPGISVLKASSPKAAALQMRLTFPNATGLHKRARTVGSANEDRIRAVGFDIIPAPSKKLPNHFRIIHPDGVKGFKNEANLERLSKAFTDTKGN